MYGFMVMMITALAKNTLRISFAGCMTGYWIHMQIPDCFTGHQSKRKRIPVQVGRKQWT